MAHPFDLPFFNVRVYGILISDDKLLVTDEIHATRKITKFPGGGLQFGEGTIDCLKREFMEELQMEINILSHFYTADFFQPSAFDPSQQVISIYYLVSGGDTSKINIQTARFAFKGDEDGQQLFRWVPIMELSQDEFTFPIDKHVSELLRQRFMAGKY